MQLERWQKFDVLFQPDGSIILVQKDTPPWRGRALFLTKQPDGTFVYSCGIEEQGPSIAFGAVSAIGWMMVREIFANTDVQLWSEMTGKSQGAD